MTIGVAGAGVVGQTLAAGLLKHRRAAAIGTRDPGKLAEWAANNPGAQVKGFADAAAFSEIVVLAVAGEVALDVLNVVGPAAIDGKTVVDACNPIGGGPPVAGGLSFFTRQNESLTERLQKAFPNAHLVKAFKSVGAGQMVNPQFAGGRPTVFVCGDSAKAKHVVAGICDAFGQEVEDMGSAEAAWAREPLGKPLRVPGVGKAGGSAHALELLR